MYVDNALCLPEHGYSITWDPSPVLFSVFCACSSSATATWLMMTRMMDPPYWSTYINMHWLKIIVLVHNIQRKGDAWKGPVFHIYCSKSHLIWSHRSRAACDSEADVPENYIWRNFLKYLCAKPAFKKPFKLFKIKKLTNTSEGENDFNRCYSKIYF